MKVIIFSLESFTNYLLVQVPDATAGAVTINMFIMIIYFVQVVIVLFYMSKVTTALQECQGVIICTVVAKNDQCAREAKELQALAELVQLTDPCLSLFGQPITAPFVQSLILYAPTAALLIYGAVK